jgi:hypothetical protein
MARAYNATYRENLIRNGVPDRRTLAEAIMQAVLEEAMTPTPDAAKRVLRSAAAILRSVVSPDGSSIYNNNGIRTRIARVADEMSLRRRSPAPANR